MYKTTTKYRLTGYYNDEGGWDLTLVDTLIAAQEKLAELEGIWETTDRPQPDKVEIVKVIEQQLYTKNYDCDE